jgi:hypothetical protein
MRIIVSISLIISGRFKYKYELDIEFYLLKDQKLLKTFKWRKKRRTYFANR